VTLDPDDGVQGKPLKETELAELGKEGAAILADLQEPDELTRRFNPWGLGGQLSAEDAARFQSAVIASAVLAEGVPEAIRDNFARVRKLHLYGVLEYDFFTVAAEYALLVLEAALRLRFVSYYESGIPVTARGGLEKVLTARTFDDVRSAKSKGSSLQSADGARYPLPVGGHELFEWARRERLLPGTRTRGVDRALSNLRNFAAHPVSHTVLMPPDSSGTIRDVAEIINKLWGHDTPDGRFFTGPVERRPRVVGLSPDRTAAVELRVDQVREVSEAQRSWLYAVFLAAGEERLTDYGISFVSKPGFQTTFFPCEKLWEGSWRDLVQAVESEAFAESVDTVEYLDRLFFLRRDEGALDLARSTEDLLALESAPEGEWFAIIADSPIDAYVHVRDHELRSQRDREACPQCFVKIRGRFDNVLEAIAFARWATD
jgi:hypothetical protein